MTPILHFERKIPGNATETVRMGAVVIGTIQPVHYRDHQAAYALWLPDMLRGFRPAGSFFQARSALIRAVEEWLLRIGVFYPGQSVEIRVPHEDVDDADVREPARARA